MATSSIVFDGWEFIGTSPGGGRWSVKRFDDWVTRTERRDRTPRANTDGDWPAKGSAEGALYTFSGLAVYADPVQAAQERLAVKALGGHELSELTVTDAAGSLTAYVEVDRISVAPVTDTMLAFTITVHAPDPLLYGPQTYDSTSLGGVSGAGRVWPRVWPRDWGVPEGETPGSVSLRNDGTATYWPTLRIDGPVANPVVTVNETGDWVRINRTITAGQWLDIDCGERSVLLNGQISLAGNVTYSGSWLGIPKGGASMSFNDDGAAAAALLGINGFEGAYS